MFITKPSKNICKEFIHYFNGIGGYQSQCHIRVLDEENKPMVIMCTQVVDNPGTSITNAIEKIANEINEKYPVHKNRQIIWIQHYGFGNSITGYSTYAIVNFRKPMEEPQLEYVTADYLMEYTGYDVTLFDTPIQGQLRGYSA